MITLASLPRSDLRPVLHLTLGPGQDAFVSPVEDMAADPNPACDLHAIWSGATAVGFFKIDRGYASDHDFAAPNHSGLRGFLIGAQYQGQGHGSAALAALPDYLRQQYPGQTYVYLTVDCTNGTATRAYLRHGWTDTGQLHHKGRSGPLFILRLDLPAPA